jgi:hypothetical protein
MAVASHARAKSQSRLSVDTGDAIGVIPLSSRRRLRNDTRTNSILLKEKPRKVVGCFPQSFSPRAPRRIRRSVL